MKGNQVNPETENGILLHVLAIIVEQLSKSLHGKE